MEMHNWAFRTMQQDSVSQGAPAIPDHCSSNMNLLVLLLPVRTVMQLIDLRRLRQGYHYFMVSGNKPLKVHDPGETRGLSLLP